MKRNHGENCGELKHYAQTAFQNALRDALDTFHPQWELGYKGKGRGTHRATFEQVSLETLRDWTRGKGQRPQKQVFQDFLEEAVFPDDTNELLLTVWLAFKREASQQKVFARSKEALPYFSQDVNTPQQRLAHIPEEPSEPKTTFSDGFTTIEFFTKTRVRIAFAHDYWLNGEPWMAMSVLDTVIDQVDERLHFELCRGDQRSKQKLINHLRRRLSESRIEQED